MNNPSNTAADLRLQAFLYLLNDPALDAVDFEARLEEGDEALAEVLSEAVEELEAIRAAQWIVSIKDSNRMVRPASHDRTTAESTHRTELPTREGSRSGVAWMVAIAAGIAIAVFVGRSPRFSHKPPSNEIAVADPDSLDVSDLSESGLVHSTISAWTQFQADSGGDTVGSRLVAPEYDLAKLSNDDELWNRDVPEWLVLAASAGGDTLLPSESDVN
jgi:hypothetical protein